MPVRFSELSNLTSPKAVIRGLQMLFACAAFSLAAAAGQPEPGTGPRTPEAGAFATLAMFSWCFSFTVTLLIFLAEFTQIHSLLPVSWKNLPVALAAYAALMNLAASVSYPLLVLSSGPGPAAACPRPQAGLSCYYQIAATVCSCLAFLAYSAEVLLARCGEGRAYMVTAPGLLKVLQVSLAGPLAVILVTAAIQPGTVLQVCAALLAACTLLPLVAMATMVGECRCRACCPLLLLPRRLLLATSLLATLLAAALLGAWSLGLALHIDLLARCSRMDCPRNRLLLATTLLAVNLLAYVADLVYSIKLTCSRS